MTRLWPIFVVIPFLSAIVLLQWQETNYAEDRLALQERADRPFMTILQLSYSDGYIFTERVINLSPELFPEGVVADWRVTVVRDNRKPPSCQTVPGPQIDQGWSIYDQFDKRLQSLPFDVWVGDPGCYERLTNGDVYHMHVTWTPRDPSLAPARASMTFVLNRNPTEAPHARDL